MELDKQHRESSGAEKKSELFKRVNSIQGEIRDLHTYFSNTTPMAKQLKLWDELDKLMRAAEKVKAGFQELVL